MAIVGSPRGLCRIILPQQSLDHVYDQLGPFLVDSEEHPEAFGDLAQRLCDYFAGKQVDFPDKLEFGSTTSFQRAVWQAARTIPYGETRSYGWLAKQAGTAKAARAVGQAMRNNPWPVIVPCHRVIASTGQLCGFAGGLQLKLRLLQMEGCKLPQH